MEFCDTCIGLHARFAGFSDKDVAQEGPSDSALKEKEEAEVQRGHDLGSFSITFGFLLDFLSRV